MADSIATPDSSHAHMASYWRKVAPFMAGLDRVRQAGQAFLPKFRAEETDDYEERRKNARLTNIFKDIVSSLAARPFAEKLTLDDSASDAFTDLENNIDGRGTDLHVFAGNTFQNGIENAMDFILVEMPVNQATTRAEEIEMGIRPYWDHIKAPSVLHISWQVVGGNFVMSDFRYLTGADSITQYVIEDGLVRRRLWVKVEKPEPDQWAIAQETDLTIDQIPIVPFRTGPRIGQGWAVNPPMESAIDLQIELYQQENGLKNISMLTAFPMLQAEGIDKPVGESLSVGPHSVLFTGSPGVGSPKYSWLTPDRGVLDFLSSEVEKTKKDLRELGKVPLTADSGNLTVVTTMFAAQKGNSAVQQWALMLKNALDQALVITAKWLNEQTAPKTVVYTEFGLTGDAATNVSALLQMRQPNEARNVDLSQETFWAEMERHGVLAKDFDPDQEQQRILLESGLDNE